MRRKITYDPNRDYYLILGVDAGATASELKRAYRRRAREVHPDHNLDRVAWATKQLQLLNEAYDVLSNALLRREYDRARWPHVGHTRTSTRHRESYSPPTYDPDRPWWEQVAERAPRGYPFSAEAWADNAASASARWDTATMHAQSHHRPAWLRFAEWLDQRNLSPLSRIWITLVGLWRTPYAGILTVLAVVLALNMALIIYAFIEPDALDQIEALFVAAEASPTTPPPTPAATFTPVERLNQRCNDPQARITVPVSGDVIGDYFSVYGTVTHPDLWHYQIRLGYLGLQRTSAEPDDWQVVRAPPRNQTTSEPPVTDGLLTEDPIDLSDAPPGYYAVRLRVVLRSSEVLEPCDVVVLH